MATLIGWCKSQKARISGSISEGRRALTYAAAVTLTLTRPRSQPGPPRVWPPSQRFHHCVASSPAYHSLNFGPTNNKGFTVGNFRINKGKIK